MKTLKIILFVFIFTFSLICTPLSAEDTEPTAGITPENIPPEHPKGFVSDKIYIEGIGTVEVEDLVNQAPMLLSDEEFPKNYDATKEGLITTVKNQRNFGTCWAFSSISAIETNMIKKGYESVYDVDYSELHHAYFTHAKNTAFGDGQKTYSSIYGYYGGDNTINSSSYLAGWQGIVNEEDFPYPPSSIDYTIPEEYRYQSVAHMQDYLRIPNTENSIKAAILEYGSITAAYYDCDSYSKNYAFYQNATTSSNHAITIVGWDDNYAISNFEGLSAVPSSPGAWKVKNSWGEHWGNSGYFWISYEEPSLKYIAAFNAEPADNYQIIHQYDGAAPSIYAESQSAANIFTAPKNEVLEAVGFYNYTAGITYSVKVYSLFDNATAPLQGNLVSSCSGAVSNVGYHTVTLDTPATFSEGDRFSVVVSLGDGLFAFEGDGNSSKAGESFIFNGRIWQDSSSSYVNYIYRYNNACIKAYATDESFAVTFEENGGSDIPDTSAVLDSLLDIPDSPTHENKYFAGWYKDSALKEKWDFDEDRITSEITLYAAWSDSPIPVNTITIKSDISGMLTGDSITLSCKVSPYFATNTDILWASSSTGASVTDGVVTGNKKGSYIITASATDGSDVYCQYKVQVYDPMKNIEVRSLKPVYTTAETDRPAFQLSGENVEHFDFYIMLPSGSGLWKDHAPTTAFAINYSFGEGMHTFYALAYDPLGNVVKSEVKTFWVTNNPMLIARRIEEGYQAGGFNGCANSKVFVAYYKDDSILAVSSFDKINTLSTLKNIKDADSLKIMWWDIDSGNSPLTDFIEIDTTSDDPVGKIFTAE